MEVVNQVVEPVETYLIDNARSLRQAQCPVSKTYKLEC